MPSPARTGSGLRHGGMALKAAPIPAGSLRLEPIEKHTNMATYRNNLPGLVSADQPSAMEYRAYPSGKYAAITAAGHTAGIYDAAADILAIIASSAARGALSGAISGIVANLHASPNIYGVLYHTVPGAIKGMHYGIFKSIISSIFGKEFSAEFKLGNMIESVFTNEFPIVALRADNKIVEHVLFPPLVDKSVYLLYQIKYSSNPDIRLAPPDFPEKYCNHLCTVTKFSILGAVSMYFTRIITELTPESMLKILSSYMARGAFDHIYDSAISKLTSSIIQEELDTDIFPALDSEDHELLNPLTKSGANPNAVDAHGDTSMHDPVGGTRVELVGQCDHLGTEASLVS